MSAESQPQGATPQSRPIRVEFTFAAKIGFATHQNEIALIEELRVVNDGPVAAQNLVLKIEADPPVVAGRQWVLDTIPAQTNVRVEQRDLALNGGLLAGLTETMMATVVVSLRRQDSPECIDQSICRVEVLARNEWGGSDAMPDLLAAFVLPNDTSVARLLRRATDLLRQAGRPAALEGYTGGSRRAVWDLASALWSAVRGLDLAYAAPPPTFATQGLKIRLPTQVLEDRLANGLDVALLVAAALEQAGLNPVVVLSGGRALAGVWLQPQQFVALMIQDAEVLRKRVDLHDLLLFATDTVLGSSPEPPTFVGAVAAAARALAEDTKETTANLLGIDIRRARMRRIRPLALAAQEASEAAVADGGEVAPAERLAPPPPLPEFDVAVAGPEPTHAHGRLERWQRQLLDLSTRNRLLHVKPGATAIPLICPQPARLEDELADGASFRIVSKPDLVGPSGRDPELHVERTGRSLEEAYALEALGRKEILSSRPSAELEAQLIDLYRKARLDLREGGANTLFLTVGCLSWTKAPNSPASYLAPLILLPVELERQSVKAGVRLRAHEDEPRFNLTLLEMLRRDFDLDIPQLAGTLPTDASGLDVPAIWTAMRRAVQEMEGFEVVPTVLLGTFSFNKYLLWRDLVDRADLLKENPVVRHLLETPREPYVGRASVPRPETLDHEVEPADLFTPLPADSSQLAAVIGSARGCDFVLDGPPGTGKSQTIANMIAHNLAKGRTVLFVAEKMAALEVVYSRLEAHGLGAFCLQLHSNKAHKQDVLRQLGEAWNLAEASPELAWARRAEELKHTRDGLNRFVKALHRPYPNGMSIFSAVGVVTRDRGRLEAPRLTWPPNPLHSGDALARLRDIVRRLETLRPPPEAAPALLTVGRNEWSSAWAGELVSAAEALQAAAEEVSGLRQALGEQLGSELGRDAAGLATAAGLARALGASAADDLGFAFEPTGREVMASARSALQILATFRAEVAGAEGHTTPEAIESLVLDEVEAEWGRANASIWPLSLIRRRAVAHRLALPAAARVSAVLPRLRRLRGLLSSLAERSAQAGQVPGWAGAATDLPRVEALLDQAEGLQAAVARAADTPERLAALRARLGFLVGEGREAVGPSGAVGACAAAFVAAHARLDAALEAFATIAGSSRRPAGPDAAAAAREMAAGVMAQRHQLHAWTKWCRARQDAIDHDLRPLVEAMSGGAVGPGEASTAFELSYARWWVEAAIDAEATVRDFTRAEQSEAVDRFRRLDDEVRRLSELYIRGNLAGGLPAKDDPRPPPGYGVLAHQQRLLKGHMPVRQLLEEMGPAVAKLAPCVMMSPLSVAQYLPATAPKFDLVIFDEASQVTPWDAIGAIARGRQLVVAGDPKQMPPTRFFVRGDGVDDGDVEGDEESILDACQAARLPQRRLTWHYRSRHETLIAFSNHRYYEGELITFPAPVCEDRAVSWRHVPGEWSRGQARTNQIEAKAIVGEVIARLNDPTFTDDTGRPLSIAVITLNAAQQQLVEDLLDQARRGRPELERFFATDVAEPVIVKNLETVQGDERDVVLLGIGYGPAVAGDHHMTMNFGPLNLLGGWRRLNVALTRARRQMILFTSFPATSIDLNRTRAQAVRDLRLFIEYAQKGPRALLDALSGSRGDFESPFETAVARGLRERGWIPVPQVGVSRFRIDLGIVHPDRPGDYLAGVECDGATYHSAATARDRDKVREMMLSHLGWRLVRVWSTDWWHDSLGALARLDASLRALLEVSRAVDAEAAAKRASAAPTAPAPVQDPADGAPLNIPVDPDVVAPGGDYRRTRFDEVAARIAPERFNEPEYLGTLADLVRLVLHQEAPVRDTVLVERIARAHGFKRSGRRIRERVLEVAKEVAHLNTELGDRTFLWADASSAAVWQRARLPATRDDVRDIEDICLAELRALLAVHPGENGFAAAARALGIHRLSPAVKERLQSAMHGEKRGD